MTEKKITLTFDDTPAMRAVLRHLAEYAAVWGTKIVLPEDRSAVYEAFDAEVARAIDVDEPGALVAPIAPTEDVEHEFVHAVIEATIAHDVGSEHDTKQASVEGGFAATGAHCVRCAVVAVLPKGAQRIITNARAGGSK